MKCEIERRGNLSYAEFKDKYLFANKPVVVTDAIRGIDRDASEQLLREWGDEGVRLIRTKEIVEEGLVEALARATA